MKDYIFDLLLRRSIACSHFVDHPTEASEWIFNQSTKELKDYCKRYKLDYKKVLWLSDKPSSWVDDELEKCKLAA